MQGAQVASLGVTLWGRGVVAMALAIGATVISSAPSPSTALSVTLTPSMPGGPPVGTTVVWTAAAGGAPLVYRFSVGAAGGPLHVVRDYSATPSFAWTPMQEGSYSVAATVKQGFGVATAITATSAYTVVSRVVGNAATVTATPHPLVALYSAPPCAAGAIEVIFRAMADTTWHSTNWRPCQPGLSANFLVGGMRANTTYALLHVVANGGIVSYAPMTQTFTTGSRPLSLALPGIVVQQGLGSSSQASLAEGVEFQSVLTSTLNAAPALATDLSGRLLWYYDRVRWPEFRAIWVTNLVAGGTVLLLGSVDGTVHGVLREVDLAGDPLRETSMERINEQLTARGQESILGFHHEATRLPNGYTAVLGYIMRLVGGVNIMSDMVIVLDTEWQVAWTWDAFDHLDVNRLPVLGETCVMNYAQYCPVPDPQARDWLHSNAIIYSPSDGNLLISMRDQDWVIKLDYHDGTGSGAVVWRLGAGGDFTITSSDPSPWFSHQHAPRLVGPGMLTLFDNGNTRCHNAGSGCDSRGQVITLDEQRHTATLGLNADLGNYSDRLGSAQKLSSGNYAFTSGFQLPTYVGQSIEVLPDGSKTYVQETESALYRTYRVKSLYTDTGS